MSETYQETVERAAPLGLCAHCLTNEPPRSIGAVTSIGGTSYCALHAREQMQRMQNLR